MWKENAFQTGKKIAEKCRLHRKRNCTIKVRRFTSKSIKSGSITREKNDLDKEA
jgi:hypothetical protein